VTVTAALLAAWALPDARLGLGLTLVATLVVVAALLSGALPATRYSRLLIALAIGLGAMAVLRATEWLVWVDLAAAIVLAVVAAAGARTWGAMRRSVTGAILHAPLALVFVRWATGVRAGPRAARRVLPIARGLALGATLAFVFGVLFASADAAFAEVADGVLDPDIDLGPLPARIVAFVTVVAAAGVVVIAALLAPPEPSTAVAARRGSAEWIVALALLNGVFLLFVAIQATVLFGGDRHVLETTGLTYAEYAREGFFQLLLVAFLTLLVVAIAGRRRGGRKGRRPTAVEGLLGLLCLLTLVVLASALRRLGLYEDAYGFTVARLVGHAATLWIGAVIALVLAAGALRATWLPQALVALTAAALFAFSLVNPEGWVAERNVERYEESGKIDDWYLGTLGPDATPALAELPRRVRENVLGVPPRTPAADGFFELNVGRARARAAVEDLR
jgi:hypothetical protein